MNTVAHSKPLLQVDDWYQLPSGRIVVIRRVNGPGPGAEATVRYINDEGQLANGEFELSVAFVLRGRRLDHA
jgi:hypothetical protein